MNELNIPSTPKSARWKSLIIAATAVLVVAGMTDVLFNLPVVTGDVPQ